MSYQPFYISSFEENSGIQTYHEPFLIPEKAFAKLEDAYVFRGRIKRKKGYDLLGRLRRTVTGQSLGNTGASPWSVNIYTVMALTGEDNAEIQASSVTITAGAVTWTDAGDGTLVSATPGNSGTINYQTWDITLTHTVGAGVACSVTFSYYPMLPCMGLPTYENNTVNVEETYAFDTKYAYKYTGGQFSRVGTATWNGTDSDFFWTTNYWQTAANVKLLWVTNFNQGATPNPIRYWNNAAWTNFTPILRPNATATPIRLYNARCIIPYKGRLLAFNTYEGTTAAGSIQYPSRMRWSQNGTPTTVGAIAGAAPFGWTTIGAWADDRIGYGGYVDAPTAQQIVSVGFIKDTLLVKFERSSWKVIYTGNEQLPFVFEKINTELGAESTFSLVSFDKGVLAFGNYGITSDDSVNVSRIDEQIPQYIQNVNNDYEGPRRVHGIRDFPNELAYWCYPTQEYDAQYPDKVLVYNYRNDSYSVFNDAFTCFGYNQKTSDLTWGDFTTTRWRGGTFRWDTGTSQSQYPDTIGGNQHGYVEILNRKIANDPSLTITAFTTHATNPLQVTIPNHNLRSGMFIKITGVISTGANPLTILNDNVYRVIYVDVNTITLQEYNTTTGTFDPVIVAVGATYLGLGKVQTINNFNIVTKRFAPFYESGGQARLAYLDFLFDKTDDGELVNIMTIDEDTSTSVTDLYANIDVAGNPASGILGTGILLTRPENTDIIPYQANQEKIWHRYYVQTICQNFQIQLKMSDVQMQDEDISGSEFVMHALVLYLSKNARLIQ